MKAIDSSIEKLNCSIRALVVARVVPFFFEYDKRSVVVPFVLANPSEDTRGQSAEKVTKSSKKQKAHFFCNGLLVHNLPSYQCFVSKWFKTVRCCNVVVAWIMSVLKKAIQWKRQIDNCCTPTFVQRLLALQLQCKSLWSTTGDYSLRKTISFLPAIIIIKFYHCGTITLCPPVCPTVSTFVF